MREHGVTGQGGSDRGPPVRWAAAHVILLLKHVPDMKPKQMEILGSERSLGSPALTRRL